MGTTVSVELWHEEAAAGRAAADEVMAEYHRVNALLSTYITDSVLSHINREAHAAPVVIDAEVYALLERALEMSRLSDGAFDITFDSVGHHYDFRAGRVPDDDERETGLATLDWRLVRLDPERSTVEFAAEGVRLNLGGIGKGYAIERGAEILRARGIEHALLNAGGDSRVVGDRRGQPWVVGIRDPRDRDRVVARLPLVDEAISTSGDYERYFEHEGARHHHILDPFSGRPAEGVRSATVIGPDATLADALSTTVFVLGVERGMRLVAGLDGYEAVIVDGEGRMLHSTGFDAAQ